MPLAVTSAAKVMTSAEYNGYQSLRTEENSISRDNRNVIMKELQSSTSCKQASKGRAVFYSLLFSAL